jgi:hypothetical protein
MDAHYFIIKYHQATGSPFLLLENQRLIRCSHKDATNSPSLRKHHDVPDAVIQRHGDTATRRYGDTATRRLKVVGASNLIMITLDH